MDHVAIMRPSWKLIPKILSGTKTIESRWYLTRRAPWNGISRGDRVFFKDSGKPVVAAADVERVAQCTIESLIDAKDIVNRYGKAICLVNDDPATWQRLPRYAILIHLAQPRRLAAPFMINKHGFGSATAWITVPSIDAIRL